MHARALCVMFNIPPSTAFLHEQDAMSDLQRRWVTYAPTEYASTPHQPLHRSKRTFASNGGLDMDASPIPTRPSGDLSTPSGYSAVNISPLFPQSNSKPFVPLDASNRITTKTIQSRDAPHEKNRQRPTEDLHALPNSSRRPMSPARRDGEITEQLAGLWKRYVGMRAESPPRHHPAQASPMATNRWLNRHIMTPMLEHSGHLGSSSYQPSVIPVTIQTIKSASPAQVAGTHAFDAPSSLEVLQTVPSETAARLSHRSSSMLSTSSPTLPWELWMSFGERERSMRDHIRFLEFQTRKTIVQREDMDREGMALFGRSNESENHVRYRRASLSPSGGDMSRSGSTARTSMTNLRRMSPPREAPTTILTHGAHFVSSRSLVFAPAETYMSGSARQRSPPSSALTAAPPPPRSTSSEPLSMLASLTSFPAAAGWGNQPPPSQFAQGTSAAGRAMETPSETTHQTNVTTGWSLTPAVPHQSLLNRGTFWELRLEALIKEESARRDELVDGEVNVREAVMGVLLGLQRVTQRVARQAQVQRNLLLLSAEETDTRKKLMELEHHVCSSLWAVHTDGLTSLTAALYERTTLFSHLGSRLLREESRGRLELMDDEIVRRRMLLIASHENELLICQSHSRRASDQARELQRVQGSESEMRAVIYLREGEARNEALNRWAHERAVLEHTVRLRFVTIHERMARLEQIASNDEPAARQDIIDVESRLRITLLGHYRDVTRRHESSLRLVYEREWREASHATFGKYRSDLDHAETEVRRDIESSWGCVVGALAEWHAELRLQVQLEMESRRHHAAMQHLEELEELETQSRSALIFAESVVHGQHLQWMREVKQLEREDRANALAHARHQIVKTELFQRRLLIDESSHEWVRLSSFIRHERLFQAIADCVREESAARKGLIASVDMSTTHLRSVWDLERHRIEERDRRIAAAHQQLLVFIDAFAAAEWDARCGTVQGESDQRSGMMSQSAREREWIEEMAAARIAQWHQAASDVTWRETQERRELTLSEDAMSADMLRAFGDECKRIADAAQLQQRLRWQQLRTSELTLLRLEEVERDVIRGTEARETTSIEQRWFDVRRLLVEEHQRLKIIIQARQLRSFEDKRRELMDDEALQRCSILDTEFSMWHDHIMQQFDLRRPVAQSDNDIVVQLLQQEHRVRVDLQDLFTYERWNLADLEAMSRDDVVDGVSGPIAMTRQSPPRSTPSGFYHWSMTDSASPLDVAATIVPFNEFAAIIAERPLAAENNATAHHPFARSAWSAALGQQQPMPPDPTEWTFAEAASGAALRLQPPATRARLKTSSDDDGALRPPVSRPPKAPLTSRPASAAVAPPHPLEGALKEFTEEEAHRRKRIVQSQYQLLAGIIQHHIEMLPDV